MGVALPLILALTASASASDRQEADQLYQQARSDFTSGAFRMALTEATHAHSLDPKPAYLLEIAECQKSLGRWAEAAVTYQRYLALPQTRNRAAVKKALMEVQSHLPNGGATATAGGSLDIEPLVATPLVAAPPAPPPAAAPPPEPARVPVTAISEPPPPPSSAGEVASSDSGHSHAWGYTLIGVAVAAAAVGVVGWVNVGSFNSYASSVTNGQITSTGAIARQNLSSAQTWQIVAISTTIATGLAGGGAALVW